jgi:hypothetical protein
MQSLYSIETEIAEAIHREANVQAGGADHPRPHPLRYRWDEIYRFPCSPYLATISRMCANRFWLELKS